MGVSRAAARYALVSVLTLAPLGVASLATAADAPAPGAAPVGAPDKGATRRDFKVKPVSHKELKSIDEYLEHHPRTARQLAKNPALIDKAEFLAQHPQLDSFLTKHPEAREDWKQHPHTVMKHEKRLEKHEQKEGTKS